ncbi:MAG: 7-carboxy-7-deazaguanine synthase [Euryarchaeota archaeon]|nr:7-carboxy-7-deazaguanine synthase [Euryarchaeota archaeon]|tara:strand:- start:108 stop:767 length:660 start_codon:yes stop_codon:yes gene_type:complete
MLADSCGRAGDEHVDDPADLAVSYNIVEIFHSVQGEGFRSGIPHVFIRFGRCNLRCEWCDTDFDTYQEMSVIDILGEVLKFDCKNVIFTGGEPMLNDLWPLARPLKRRGFHLSVESNGTVEVPEGLLDWICISPKDQMYPKVAIKQRTGDELKCVYVGQPLSIYDELKAGFDHLFLQPCYDEHESVENNGRSFGITEGVVKENPEWRLSLQTHKWMGIL